MQPELTRKSSSGRKGPSFFGENLVFLISQPRSGSTLLQRLLAGHSDIQTSAETWLMLHPVYGLRGYGLEADYRADWAATGVNEFLENYADGRETYLSGIRSFAETIYGSVLRSSGKKYFLDKTPRYTMIVPELVELFPKARYLLLIRNPLAVLSSELSTYIGDKYWRLANYRPDLLYAPKRIIEARDICGERGITVHYEALASEPEETMRKICVHLDIDFQQEMLEYGDRPAPLGRMNDPNGIHQHTRPIVGSLDKWRQLGQNSQHRHFALNYLDRLGADTISALGYDPAELRSVIESSQIDQRISPVYPWKLAMTPQQHRRLRDRLISTYCYTAQHDGRLSGLFAALRQLLGKSNGSIRRMFQKNSSQQSDPLPDAIDSDKKRREVTPR